MNEQLSEDQERIEVDQDDNPMGVIVWVAVGLVLACGTLVFTLWYCTNGFQGIGV